jgi:hypothetical protein
MTCKKNIIEAKIDENSNIKNYMLPDEENFMESIL